MKKVLLSAAILGSVLTATAQLPDGTLAPDFTGVDINGNSHNLYDYLDQGYTVIVDVSATWCGPCWSYHQTGALEDLWADHGPMGETGVSPTTTDDIIVLWVEGDNSTGMADLLGNTGSSQGDWTAGTDFPIIDDASIAQTLGIAYFPTIYTIYPDRYLEESGQGGTTYTNVQNNIGNHSGSTGGVDGKVFTYTGMTATCADLDVEFVVQNSGDAVMPAGTVVNILDGATTLGSVSTTTALNQFETETLSTTVTISGNTTLTIEVAATGDVNNANNTYDQAVNLATETNYTAVVVNVTTDAYGSETTWELVDGSGAVVASGGPYADQSAAGAFPQPSVMANIDANDCYSLNVSDSYGDGMDAGYGAGFIEVVDGGGVSLINVAVFTDEISGNFKSGSASVVSVEENAVADMTVYPNPFNASANVTFENATALETEMTLVNALGQVVMTENLGSVSGLQTIEINGADLEAGIYMVTVRTGNSISTKRVVLNK